MKRYGKPVLKKNHHAGAVKERYRPPFSVIASTLFVDYSTRTACDSRAYGSRALSTGYRYPKRTLMKVSLSTSLLNVV